MEYDSFIEIENNGVYEHYYFNTKEKKTGRKLNINEDYFLRLVYNNKYYILVLKNNPHLYLKTSI